MTTIHKSRFGALLPRSAPFLFILVLFISIIGVARFNTTEFKMEWIDGNSSIEFWNATDSLNISSGNISIHGALILPMITTGADLHNYTWVGSLVLNTTTNYLGTYDGTNWRWR